MVTGSTIMPLSERFTLSISPAWASMLRLRCTMPMPPCCAMAMAMRDSVTVSMAEESSGVFSVMSRVSCVCVLTCVGHHVAVRGHQQHVIERESFRKGICQHSAQMHPGYQGFHSLARRVLLSIVAEGVGNA